MNIAVIGTGYVGLVSAACFADLGHNVIGVDIDAAKIKQLQQGISPIYEPGLEEVLARGLQSGRLQFTTDLPSIINQNDVIFSAVATPPKQDFSADLQAVFTVCESVAKHATKDIVFVNKSTVPVGTGAKCSERIQAILNQEGKTVHIPVVSNPEFLREGSAVSDTLNPDRIVVGINQDQWATELLDALYEPLTRTGKPMVHMSRESAELVKYASNGFLATKISFVNMLSELCEVANANIQDVTRGMGLDDRIGSRFLQAGIGFGGSCFPKDVKALMAMSTEYKVPLPIINAVHEINLHQRNRFFSNILASLPSNATVAIWGLSFKPKTDDMRDAPSLDLITPLIEAGHTVNVYDPVAMQNAKTNWLPAGIQYAASPLEAAANADATVVLTEWDVFKGINLATLHTAMKGNLLFDGRNVYKLKDAINANFQYTSIGRPST